MRYSVYWAYLTAASVALGAGGCQDEARPVVSEVVVVSAESLPLDPRDHAWDRAPEFVANLVPQDMVEPRQMRLTTPAVRVRALTDGSELAVRLDWSDASSDDDPGLAQFSDACAIQFPAFPGPGVPAPQMGEPGGPVSITYWRASWQSIAKGQGDELKDLYPNAAIDHYPFDAPSLKAGSAEQEALEKRYAPARALGNIMAGPRESAVVDLFAQGPGTLAPAASSDSRGEGLRTADGWSVVLVRKLPFEPGATARSQLAVAVWDGSQEEVGARKMRSLWIPVVMEARP